MKGDQCLFPWRFEQRNLYSYKFIHTPVRIWECKQQNSVALALLTTEGARADRYCVRTQTLIR